LLQGDVWEASLLYSQVEKAYKNEPIGQEAKFRNSRLYYYKGDFQWAKAQLDVLKAATAKFISNDAMDLSLFISSNIGSDSLTTPLEMFSRADLLYFQNRFDDSQKVLDSIAFVFPDNDLADDIIYRKANIAYRTGNFAKAADFYNEVVTKYSEELLGDDSLFKLASIYQFNLGDNTKAMDAYQKLMTDFPGSVYVVEARKRFRTLRGDKVN
jgi:tetratricopeptide (TPR) repeat protein